MIMIAKLFIIYFFITINCHLLCARQWRHKSQQDIVTTFKESTKMMVNRHLLFLSALKEFFTFRVERNENVTLSLHPLPSFWCLHGTYVPLFPFPTPTSSLLSQGRDASCIQVYLHGLEALHVSTINIF